MVTQAQKDFFEQLLGERDFGDLKVDTLRKEFVALDKISASKWIDKALTLPKVKEEDREIVEPSF